MFVKYFRLLKPLFKMIAGDLFLFRYYEYVIVRCMAGFSIWFKVGFFFVVASGVTAKQDYFGRRDESQNSLNDEL